MNSPLSQYIFIFDESGEKASPHVRGSAKTSEPHIELHFRDRAYLVKRTKLSKLTSLSDKTASNPVLKVPADDEDMFKRLYEFIGTGNYKPAVKERQTQDPVSRVWSLGPPRIVDFDANGKAFLVTDIKMYRLAMAMDFPELKERVLARLRAQSFTNEDPCAVLEHIYHGGPALAPKSTPEPDKTTEAKDSKDSSKKPEVKRPDEGIRKWVKDWLQVKSKDKSLSNNLQILQQHPLWTEKYKKLRERGSELITDIDAVEANIKKAKKEEEQSRAKALPIDRVAELIHKAVFERFLPGRPASVPPTHNSPFAIPAENDFYPSCYPYVLGRSQDDSEIMPNSKSVYQALTEQDLVATLIRNLADVF